MINWPNVSIWQWKLPSGRTAVKNMHEFVSTVIVTDLHMFNKSNGKRRNTLGCLDQYMCNMLRLWNSRDHETV